MSERIDLLVYLKSTLNHALATKPDSPGVQTLHRLVTDAGSISDEHFNQVASFLPHAPKLLLAVVALNESIVAGNASPASFYEYLGSLAASLQA